MKKSIWFHSAVTVATIAGISASTSSVWAGYRNTPQSWVWVDAGDPGSASGRVAGAYNSSDSNQYIGCELYAESNFNLVSCWAKDPNGTYAGCDNFDPTPGMMTAVAALTSMSSVSFGWDSNGKCNMIDVDNESYNLTTY